VRAIRSSVDVEGPTARPSWSERFERSTVGRALIIAGVLLVLLLEVGTHLPPDSAAHDRFDAPAREYLRAIGAEQAWGVFAPNPRRVSIGLEATVTFADGSTTTWTLPHGAAIGENLRYYRWRKWLERARSDDYKSLWEPTAAWIASLYEDESSAVIRVELIRHFRRNDVTGPQPAYESVVYFTYVPPKDRS
jgi:hypothetical protein